MTIPDATETSLVQYLLAAAIPGLEAGHPFVSSISTAPRPIPGTIVGNVGVEDQPNMTGTAKVLLALVVQTDMDQTSPAQHELLAGAIDRHMRTLATKPGPVPGLYLHRIQAAQPATVIEDRRQKTMLRYDVMLTIMEEQI
jgi:hypothetical protein